MRPANSQELQAALKACTAKLPPEDGLRAIAWIIDQLNDGSDEITMAMIENLLNGWLELVDERDGEWLFQQTAAGLSEGNYIHDSLN